MIPSGGTTLRVTSFLIASLLNVFVGPSLLSAKAASVAPPLRTISLPLNKISCVIISLPISARTAASRIYFPFLETGCFPSSCEGAFGGGRKSTVLYASSVETLARTQTPVSLSKFEAVTIVIEPFWVT